MELYLSVWSMFAWSITVAVLGFVAFPWGIVAYKVWYGNKPVDEELGEELLRRSFYAGYVLGGAAIVLLVLDYLTVSWLEMPAGPVHLVYYLGFLALGSAVMMYFFSMEDFLQGLVLTVVYLYLPAAVLFLLSYVFRNPLQVYVLEWLAKPTE